jgi:hypothetical protein
MRIYKNLRLLNTPNYKLKVIATYRKEFGVNVAESKKVIEKLLIDNNISFNSPDFLEDFIRRYFQYDFLEITESKQEPVYERKPDVETQDALNWYNSLTPLEQKHVDKLVLWETPVAMC